MMLGSMSVVSDDFWQARYVTMRMMVMVVMDKEDGR